MLINNATPLLTLASLLVAPTVFSQSGSAPPPQDDPQTFNRKWSVSFSGAFNHTGRVRGNTGTDQFSINGDLRLGYFFTRHLQFEGKVRGNANLDDDFVARSGSSSYLASLKYHFTPSRKFVPYIGPQIGGTTFYTAQTTSFDPSFGGMVGFDYFLREDFSLFAEYDFLYQYDSAADTDIYNNSFRFGLTYWFGSGS